jgi:hypothetical protein
LAFTMRPSKLTSTASRPRIPVACTRRSTSSAFSNVPQGTPSRS